MPWLMSNSASVCEPSASTTWKCSLSSKTESKLSSLVTLGKGSSNPSSNNDAIMGCSEGDASSGQFLMSRSRYIRNLLNEKNPRTTRSRSTVHPSCPLTASATASRYSLMSKASDSGSSGSVIPNSRRNFSLRETLDSGSSPVWRSR